MTWSIVIVASLPVKSSPARFSASLPAGEASIATKILITTSHQPGIHPKTLDKSAHPKLQLRWGPSAWFHYAALVEKLRSKCSLAVEPLDVLPCEIEHFFVAETTWIFLERRKPSDGLSRLKH
ncbi:MAG: hypothetical protein JWO59_620 [Chloroflexi bacterium]|nr:hypothetical protein [Chloroflexota bacterium]